MSVENTNSTLIVLGKKNPRDLTAPERFYLQAVKTGKIDLPWLAGLIADQSTVREADCLAVLNALVLNMIKELSQGRVVELGSLGNFQVGVNSEGSDLPEEVNLSKLKRVRLNYRPSKKMQKALNNIEFTVINEEVGN